MKISDLKAGKHAVKTREGKMYLVAFTEYSRCLFLMGEETAFGDLDSFNEDMTHDKYSNLDIVEVFTLRAGSPFKFKGSIDSIWREDSLNGLCSQLKELEDDRERITKRLEEKDKQILALKSEITDLEKK